MDIASDIYDRSSGVDVVRAFVDDDFSAVMVKVGSATGSRFDPAELLPGEARSLATALLALADRLDENDGEPLSAWPIRPTSAT